MISTVRQTLDGDVTLEEARRGVGRGAAPRAYLTMRS